MLKKGSFALILAAALAACGQAKVIQRTQTGGVIELDGDRGKAMEQARGVMDGHCGPNNYQIVQEGEEVIGQDTFTQENTNDREHTSKNGRTTNDTTTTNQQTSTRDATAWRVHYQCGAAGAPPPGGPAPGGVPPGDPNQPPPPPAGAGY
jgi:hypothetical protein